MEHKYLPRDWRVKTTYAISRFAIRHDVKGACKFRRWFAKLLMPRPGGAVVVETLHGFKLLVDPGVGKDLEKSPLKAFCSANWISTAEQPRSSVAVPVR